MKHFALLAVLLLAGCAGDTRSAGQIAHDVLAGTANAPRPRTSVQLHCVELGAGLAECWEI